MTSHSTLDDSTPLTPTPNAPAEDVAMFPPSFSQELLWLLDRANPGNASYNVPRTRRLVGPLDASALRSAFDALLARHEVLRTTYGFHEEHPVQVIHAPRPVEFVETDLRGVPANQREAEVARLAREAAARPFDLGVDLPLRVSLWRLADEEHVLLFESHHICFDGWSREIMLRELRTFYESYATGSEPTLEPLPIQYADYSIWQREELQGERLTALIDYWRRELGDASYVLELPIDFPRPAKPGTEGVMTSIKRDADRVQALKKLGQSVDATLYMVLLSAYQTVLHRLTGQPDVLVGSPIAGRAQPQTEGLIGYFANTIVQRGRFAGDPTFRELLAQVRSSALGAYDHQEVPFEKLVLELQGAQRLTHSPIFQVVFTQLDAGGESFSKLGAAEVRPFGLERNETKFDLTLFMAERPDGTLELHLRGRTDLFRAETVERILARIGDVLDAAIEAPDTKVSQLPVLSADEQAQLAATNATDVNEGPATTVVALFEAQAARVPGRLAVVGPRASATAAGSVAGTTPLTYEELNARANQLARHLAALGVQPGATVGLALDRSADALVGLVGILKAGAAYVPMSPELPAARRAQLARESGAVAVVTNAAYAGDVPNGIPVVALDRDAAALGALSNANADVIATPDSLAYVLYTSGSTGVPKGVAVTHANVVHYARAVSRVLGDVPATQAGDGLATLDGLQLGMVSTLGADLGNTSLYPALLAGATLHLLAKEVATEPARFAEYVSVHQLDVLKITPNHLRALTSGRTGSELAAVLPRQWLVTGGEALAIDFARQLVAAGKCRVLNHYGPTETTVGVCTFEATTESLDAIVAQGAATVPIGRPLSNTRLFVVVADPSQSSGGELAPPGTVGELLIGGLGVAQGYVNRPEQTAERFVQFDGERVYRTGDRVRRLTDGAIEFLGRADDQVKVRGYRVELGEIEQALRANPGVETGVVILRTDDEDPQLVAYAVPKAAGYAVSHSDRPTAGKLREWLAAQLPEYMVPNAVVLLDKLPLTPNGKLDKAALPVPGKSAEQEAVSGYAAPRTTIEHELAAIWEGLFPGKQIGIRDDFFQLGGHSLLAIRLLGKIKMVRGQRLPMATLFENATIEKLALVIANAVHAEAEPPFVVLNPDAKGQPFAFVHGDARGAGWYTRSFAKQLKGHKIIVLPTVRPEPGAPETIPDMAALQVRALREAQPEGPYALGGYCAGGIVAFEMAQQLRAAGQQVTLLLLVDSAATNSVFRPLRPLLAMLDRLTPPEQRLDKRAYVLRRLRYYRNRWLAEQKKSSAEQWAWALRVGSRIVRAALPTGSASPNGTGAAKNGAGKNGAAPAVDELALEEQMLLQGGPAQGPGRDTLVHQSRASAAYVHDDYAGAIVIVNAVDEVGRKRNDPTRGWGRVAKSVEPHEIASTHVGIITRELDQLAAKVGEIVTKHLG